MANPAYETGTRYPFKAFNFKVEINVDGIEGAVCSAAFAECDGMEMSMKVETIREGGNNGQQIHLTGPMSFGQLTLKRGMTPNFDLWEWMNKLIASPGLRADADITVYDADGNTKSVGFLLKRCVPIKLRAPSLNAKEGTVAIEEMQLSYEALELKK